MQAKSKTTRLWLTFDEGGQAQSAVSHDGEPRGCAGICDTGIPPLSESDRRTLGKQTLVQLDAAAEVQRQANALRASIDQDALELKRKERRREAQELLAWLRDRGAVEASDLAYYESVLQNDNANYEDVARQWRLLTRAKEAVLYPPQPSFGPVASDISCDLNVSYFANAQGRFRVSTSVDGSRCKLTVHTVTGLSPMVINLLNDGSTIDVLRGNIGGPYGDSFSYSYQPGSYDALVIRLF